ncbi:hypothetical protein QEZ52_05275 [Aliisedimentitalea scapharcae]|uniref:Sulfotransferase family protein n=1 Tax=Aliisedimentitalea scapharcae TaxID=1524259 RepID=A0ABZ2XV34_9RHOB
MTSSLPRVLIHCGVQKTASTAFHHFVQRNRDLLSRSVDIRTPVKGSPTRELGRVAALFSLDDTHEADLIARVTQVRDAVLSEGKPCVLSHENIPGAMLGRGGVVTLYPEIERILDLFVRHLAPLRPEFVFYTRDMAAWKVSVHNQAVKSDGYGETLDTFLEQTRACGTWDDLQARVAAVVGAERTHFLRLEEEENRAKPGMQLLRLARVPDADIRAMAEQQGRRNESLNAGSLEFLRQLNQQGLPRAARKPVVQLIQGNQALFVPELDRV